MSAKLQASLARDTDSTTVDVLGGGNASRKSDEPEPGWVSVKGKFTSIKCLVSPCRSEKTAQGVYPYGHLADGEMYLILVRSCSRIQYLQFLLDLHRNGVRPGCLPFVEVVHVTGVQVTPQGAESSWNVDGEVLSRSSVSMSVHRALIDVFARGVESITT